MSLLCTIWNWLLRISGTRNYELGYFIVAGSPSPQEISVKVDGEVCQVWLSIESEGAQVCGGGICYVGEPHITPSGFTISVIIPSGICNIKWLAVIK